MGEAIRPPALLEPVVGGLPVARLRPPTAPLAIEDVYEREHLPLFRYVKGVVRDQELAEDILQESFLRLVAEVRAGDAPDDPHAWLYRVATNLVVSRARRSQVMVRHLPELVQRRDVRSPEQLALQAERDAALQAALAALPIESRAAVVLASSGFSAREIGSIMGRSEGAVRMLVSRGRLRIRRLLAAAGVTRPGGEA